MVLQKAKALLRTGAPLAGAAFDSGFCDQAHLTREFVRTYGFTPKAFRAAWSS
jgi:AraC-like DNA-binding protein